jgi:pimeloyl-ACP methyl ester carboxylesterase
MHWKSEVTERGVTERGFDLSVGDQVVPGIAWTPAGAGPRATVLLGHGGTQHKRTEGLLALARRLVRHLGYAAIAIDAPGHGDRQAGSDQDRVSPDEMRRRVAAMTPEQQQAMVERNRIAVGEWTVTLDAIEKTDEFAGGPFGYWGVSMGTGIGLPFVAGEPRISAAVLGLAGVGNRAGSERLAEAAKTVRIPILFLFQWDDELMQREHGLALFDAFGSSEKTMHINPGGHVQMPLFERDAVEAFFSRHLGRPET